jgi:hypothetical protein
MGWFRNVFFNLPAPSLWLATRTVQSTIWTLKPEAPHAFIVKVPIDRTLLNEIRRIDIISCQETGEIAIVGKRKPETLSDASKPTALVGPLEASTYEPIV